MIIGSFMDIPIPLPYLNCILLSLDQIWNMLPQSGIPCKNRDLSSSQNIQN